MNIFNKWFSVWYLQRQRKTLSKKLRLSAEPEKSDQNFNHGGFGNARSWFTIANETNTVKMSRRGNPAFNITLHFDLRKKDEPITSNRSEAINGAHSSGDRVFSVGTKTCLT